MGRLKSIFSKKPIYWAAFIVLLTGIGAGTTYSFLSANKETAATSVTAIEPSPEPSVTPAALPENNLRTFLLIGYGGDGHDGGDLADVLMLMQMDTKTRRLALISIPRDLWYQENKINAAYAQGGAEYAKAVAEVVTGLPVDYAVSASFDGFKKAVDILGELTVDVPVAFDDYFYPIKGEEGNPCGMSWDQVTALTNRLSGFELEKQFPCRYEHLSFAAGKQKMDAETALKFVRSRHSGQHGGDFARSQRQQALLAAVKDKLLSFGAILDIIPFYRQVKSSVQTDLDESIIKALIMEAIDLKKYQILNISLNTDNVLNNATSRDGQYILVPKTGDSNWTGIHNFINQALIPPPTPPAE